MTNAIDLAVKLSSEHLVQGLQEAIKAWGHELGTLAVMSNMNVDTLRRKLAGNSAFTIDELSMICDVLEVQVFELCGGVDAATAVCDTTERAPQRCPAYDWCTVDDGPSHVEDGFHQEEGVAGSAPGRLRTDHVIFDGKVLLDITESFSWQVEAEESREFFRTLRAAIDTAEAKFEAFKSRVAGEVTDHA
ncbi:hypothetical protein [Leucobacter sp. L43]|uniref:hypothetical protein n=1 Tax=Leucobacter sp. L43 TaxID=2798040 RepID=UPI001905B676|nr:hypothetical protein [Leucobacter sp. L43]